MKRLITMVGLVAVVLTATALPFLPGRYDALAVGLSAFTRGVGMSSLLLVPVGVVWLLYEQRRTGNAMHRGRVGLVAAGLGTGCIMLLVGAVAALTSLGATLAVAVLTVGGLVLWRGGSQLMDWARRPRERGFGTAIALILVPGVVAAGQFALTPSLTSFAWNRTIDDLAPLIADIERYRATRGHYPTSLFSEWMDYRPTVIGVRGYQYALAGDGYRLAVEVPTFSIDSREFLFYSSVDIVLMASHDADLLRRTDAELAQYRGYSNARSVGRARWRVLSFD